MTTAAATRTVLIRVAIVASLVGAGFVYGYLTHRQRIFPYWWIRDVAVELGAGESASYQRAHPRVAAANAERARREALGEGAPMDEQARRQLEALGYATGTQPARPERGVLIHDRDRVQPGLNLYASAHGREAVLMDMDGRVLHRWTMDDTTLWPDRAKGVARGYFRRVRLLPGGHLLAVFEGYGIVRLDREGELVWKVGNGAHHDISFDHDGNIVVPTRQAELVRDVEEIAPLKPVLLDYVERLDLDGRRLQRIALLDAFRRSSYAPVLRFLRPQDDPFHTNSARVVRQGGQGEPFLPGRVLLSIRELNTLALLDPQSASIVWSLTGQWHRQHEATLLDNGNILLFDNKGVPMRSRVLELDPASQKVVWSYGGKPEHEFYSSACGTAMRLANGNTLVTESDRGRAFEVAPDGEIVWEFLSPHRAPHRNELVATLFELSRVPAEQPWLTTARPQP